MCDDKPIPRCICDFGPDDVIWHKDCYYHGDNGTMRHTVVVPGKAPLVRPQNIEITITADRPSDMERRGGRPAPTDRAPGEQINATTYQQAKLDDRYKGIFR